MRLFEQLRTEPVELDFSSSGQSRKVISRSLYGDDVLLSNAITLARFEDPMQLLICEHCGVPHCSTGGWTSLRRFGARVILLPAFERMAEGERELGEYSPPPDWSEGGIPVLSESQYSEVQGLVSSLPGLGEVPMLTGPVAVRALQWEAPGAALGVFPARPRLDPDSVLGASAGDPRAEAEGLNQLLGSLLSSPAELASAPVGSPMALHLDLPGTPEWSPLARLPDGGLGLNLGPGGIAVR